MVIIKRQKLKAYILLESLVALALLATITILVLGEMDKNRHQMQDSLHQQEVLNVATMAAQTGQDDLVMNGVEVHITRRDGELYVYDGQKEVMHVKKN
ncbi:competence type IV pilus minor pilin ComGE [Streptococcus equinus]|uniref:competence type IV pilus minor pilin ComGE n=1 Tax=Streptococcus equinus TaxID=1335 RepID=UPI0012FC00ED|nr:competence type IV pilus minor pilin ComGE [Streptococcus equinus]MEE0949384.1 competence type IV pilus minor pilin ComGE [Streptococcus equinus]QGX44230.1 competence protein ComGE [Streptococcus equinus]